MAENTKIEWCDHTWSPWIGCSKVSAGCSNCYAEEMMDKRYGRAKWGDAGTRVRTSEPYWKQPIKWNMDAQRDGNRPRIFPSLCDPFEDREELRPWRSELFDLIQATPHIDWLLLTKRPENVAFEIYQAALGKSDEHIASKWLEGVPPANVWIGTSVENQEAADKRIPELLKIPAKVRFLSMEPLLGPVDLTRIQIGPRFYECALKNHPDVKWMRCGKHSPEGIHWVIVGGESGRNARPMHPDWARSIRDQCEAAQVPFFFKQGSQANWGLAFKDFNCVPCGLRVREVPA